MATNFPTSLDSLSNPNATDKLNNPAHSTQHASLNDAVEALEAKVGADSSAVVTSLDYQINNITGEVPIGGIILWSGATAAIPTHYVICDGTNGTPNLRDKFVVGAGSTYAVAATGGEATHTLTAAEMPSHTHTTAIPRETGGSDPVVQDLLRTTARSSANYTATSASAGSGSAHENLPPYYALAYIMRTS